MICKSRQSDSPFARRTGLGFTILELLVVVSILAVLMSILLTTLSKVHRTANSLVCQTKLRTVTQRFTLFADDYAPTDRGDSKRFGPSLLFLDDFQESLYRVDEFWDLGEPDGKPVLYDKNQQPLMCPTGPSMLSRRGGGGLAYSVLPYRNVSYAFNMHMARADSEEDGTFVLKEVIISTSVMDHPLAPLVFDVDAEKAVSDGRSPFYTAPPPDEDSPWTHQYPWYPSRRHDGRFQAAFVGGHVACSANPAHEPGWEWSFDSAKTNPYPPS
ncbi:MAG: prepilin-type N-terminal cleavage/methylation domain-containing protein [Planctomycetota bacterium]